MNLPVKNTGCDNPNIFGGFNHHLFLGCSVMSFSANVGWNEQQSEVTVQLVEDTCAPPVGRPKVYYDTDLEPQDWTLADPGFFGLSYPIIGSPAYFRVGDFEYSGIIQGWEQSNSESGNPVYSVKLVDPRGIIENAQVIINEYAGGVGSIYNLINAFGFMESFGGTCIETYQSAPGVYSPGNGGPDGTVFGSPAGAYGGADVNNNGMQWNQILNAQRLLLSSFPATTNIWSPYGRLVSRGSATSPSEGMGLIPADFGSLSYYYLDLSEVPVMPVYWRLNGTNTTILDAITQVCQDSGHDYYIELVPVVNDDVLGSGIAKFIKIRTANRNVSPALNSIDTFVGAAGREVISYNKGREFRNEPTQSFVIGGPKVSYYQIAQEFVENPENDDQLEPTMILPYFGVDLNGNIIVPTLDEDLWWKFDAPSYDLQFQLNNDLYSKEISAFIEVNEQEILAAHSGLDAWMSYASSHKTELWKELDIDMAGVFDTEHIIKFAKNANIGPNNQPRPADIIAARGGLLKPKNDSGREFEIMQIGYAWISKFANEYYGKKFQVRVPFTCGRTDSESTIIQTSEEPTDGGWTEVATVLGLPNNSIYTDYFSLQDNRIGSMCRYNSIGGIQSSNMSPEDFLVYATEENKSAFIKIDVDPEYKYVNRSTLFSPRAIITLPNPVTASEDNTTTLQQSYKAVTAILTRFGTQQNIPQPIADNLAEALFEALGSIQLHLSMGNRMVIPSAVGFGMKSNILSYGPWGASGIAGGVNVVHDDGLVPWEYGGFTTLNLAGNAIATQGISLQQVAEEGSITVAGYPDIPLGAELRAADAGGPFSGGGNNLVENRSASSGTIESINYYYAPAFPWDGTYGPNVTGLTTQVSEGGIQTTYNMRTWTPKFGLFARYNAQRVKQIGQQRLNFSKQLRSFSKQRLGMGSQMISFLAKERNDRQGIILNQGFWAAPKTPHELLIGQLNTWNDGEFTRPLATTSSTIEAAVEMADSYDEKAFMSLDGLLRPVSMDGSGGLPRFPQLSDSCQKTSSRGSQPPIDKFGEAGSLAQYNTAIDVNYLNPFSNPSSLGRSDVTDDYSDTPDIGHDIEMIGRGDTPPASSIVMPMQGFADTGDTADSDYAEDYRMLALRGPLLMQGWGYDLDGFPVPNKVDNPTAAASGSFEDTGLQKKFMDNWLRKSETWPVGPVDLRWDRGRGVWTVPQFRDLVVRLDEKLDPNSTAVATRLNGPTLYDTSGTEITEPQVIIHDRVGNPIPSGQNAIVRFDPESCEYSVIESRASSSGGEGVFKFYLMECACIGFQHRPEGYARAMRQEWNEDAKSWIDSEEIPLYPGCANSIGPVESGACGWATNTAITGIPGTGEDPGPSGQAASVVWIEEMAPYIEFTTTTNPGCSESECITTDLRNNSAEAAVNNSWNGREPSGNIFVRWPSYVDTSCLPGYQECEETLIPYRGIAVFNKQASSAILCGTSGCRDEDDCGNWVYNIIDYDLKNTIQKVDCSGEPTEEPPIPYLNLKLGRGLDIIDSDKCSATIATTIKIGASSCCLTEASGYELLTEAKPFEYLNVGKGLYLFEDKAGACGLTATPSGECGPVHLMAGFTAVNNFDTCTPSGELTTENTFFNHIDFQGGLRAYDHEEDGCGLVLRAGIAATGTERCIVEDDEVTSKSFAHRIEFASGLIVRDKDTEDCQIEVSAGTSVITTEGCFGKDGFGFGSTKGNISEPDNFFNIFNFARGFRVEANEGNLCQLDLQSGFTVTKQDVCVSGEPDLNTIHSTLSAANGIRIETKSDCVAVIGAGIKFENSTDPCFGVADEEDVDFASTVLLGAGLRAKQSDDECNALLVAGIELEHTGTKCIESDDTGNIAFASTLNSGAGIRFGKDEDECVAFIGAGIKMVHTGTDCISSPGTIDFASTLTSGRGIRFQATDECSGIIGAGIAFSATDTCLKTNVDGTLGFVNNIELGRGLRINEGKTQCDAIIGAGIKFVAGDTCIGTSDEDEPEFVNAITAAKGIRFGSSEDDCGVRIGAGIDIASSTSCVEGGGSADFVSKLSFGKGLAVEEGSSCEASVGLDFRVNGGQVSGVNFNTNCFEVTGNSGCGTASVSLKTGSVASEVEYVVDVECDPYGNLILTTQYLQFSSCGLFMGVSTTGTL